MSEQQATEDIEEQQTIQRLDEEQPKADEMEPESQPVDADQTEPAKEDNEATAEASKRQQQFIAEFNRLKASLEQEATRIVKPEFKQYSPYIHTSLAPYYNTYTVQFLLSLPPHVRHGYITRKTAIGLVDPEVSHNMDVNVDLVPGSVPIPVTSMDPKLSPRSQGLKGGKDGMGSTRLPKWPVVKFRKTEDPNKKLDWGDVPRLRDTLKTQYSSNAQERIKFDYERTKQDWDRMELDRLREIHEVNRSHMRITCGTYLGTSKGSNKAIKNLTKVLE
ncbi:uncharacterized protein LOC110978251 isoform X2 [Acanthaster planci]|uniref:Uncharacterized protein LOC110978251 isoform X2 n=1 Tax=Acanthaster planci TaxID=133434 RepID=A0A8B7Y885_ACAPL|nr:uncharacterized protein LOC110978251 isoform X2 [Acanthaster planci]